MHNITEQLPEYQSEMERNKLNLQTVLFRPLRSHQCSSDWFELFFVARQILYSAIKRCRELFYDSGRVVQFCIDVHGLVVWLAKWVVLAVAQVQGYIEKVRDL